MASGINNSAQIDPLTAWELAAINLLIACHPEEDIDVNASRSNMLALMAALDRGELDSVMTNTAFMAMTEKLLLVMLRGEPIEVADSTTFGARKEIFAAAQVFYNQAVARGVWKLHPEISQAINSAS